MANSCFWVLCILRKCSCCLKEQDAEIWLHFAWNLPIQIMGPIFNQVSLLEKNKRKTNKTERPQTGQQIFMVDWQFPGLSVQLSHLEWEKGNKW